MRQSKPSMHMLFLVLSACCLHSGCSLADSASGPSEAAYEKIADADWQTIFHDPGTGDWSNHWFLDGQTATVSNSAEGMAFTAGPTFGKHADHAVLWTRESFSGDIRIDYEYTRLDEAVRAVTIIYVLATGSGIEPYSKDIAEWSELRTEPWMRIYFNNMHTYHVSYAAYGMENDDPEDDYIRARRYMPLAGKGLQDTDLVPDYTRTGFFKTGVPHQVTLIKKGDDLFMSIRSEGRNLLCHWKTDTFPPITEGRIGLRHMFTRSARYRDFRVSIPSPSVD